VDAFNCSVCPAQIGPLLEAAGGGVVMTVAVVVAGADVQPPTVTVRL